MSVINNSMRKALTLSLLAAAVTAVAAEPADSVATDSIAARNLKQVTVTAKNVYKVTDGYAFVPSKTVKKTSFDVKQMISRVPLSNVIVGFDGEITDIKKNEAKYFIDSKPVSQEEVKALLNKDVERIEFLNNPSDGAFLGEKFAINIVTRQAVYGGYMSVSAGQRFFQPYGSYYLSGKFVGSEKWSLMAIGGYNYSKETGSHGTETTKFDLEDHVTGEMVRIDRISQKTGSLMRHNSWSGAVFWRYKTSGNSELSVTAGISSSRTPDNNYNGILEHDNGAEGAAYSRISSGRAQYPYITAYWTKNFSNGMTLYILGDLHATFSKSWSSYTAGADPAISNYFREKAYAPNVHANWSVPLKHNNSLTLDADYKTSRFKVDYAGTVNTVENRHEDKYSVWARYRQRFEFGENELGYYLRAELPLSSITMSDGRNFSALDCSFSGSVDYSIGERHSMDLSADYDLRSRPISTMNDLKIQNTDISGYEGNPDLKSSQHLSVDLSYTWTQSRYFNLSASAGYYNESRNIVTAYNAYNGIVYTSMFNSGKRESYDARLRASLQLLDNSLLIKPFIALENFRQSGFLNYSYWNFNGGVDIDYMNPCGFSVGLRYSSPWGKGSQQDTSMITDMRSHILQITTSYSVGNLSLWLQCNPLYSYTNMKYYVKLPGVDIQNNPYWKDSFSRLIMISAKYTIDFGRKYRHDQMNIDARRITSM